MELISLQRISSLSIASQLWQHPDIKILIKKLFTGKELEETWLKYFPKSNNDSFEPSQPLTQDIESSFLKVRIKNPKTKSEKRYKNFQIIIYSVLQNFESIQLPFKLKTYCQDVIGELGEKIYKWIEFVTERLYIDYEFAEMIYWTPYGTIDKRKIMTKWENDESFQRKNISKADLLVMLGCINPNDDFNYDNLEEMEKYLKTNYPDLDVSVMEEKIYAIASLFVQSHIQSGEFRKFYYFKRHLKGTEHGFEPSDMFIKCVEGGMINSASYFWDLWQDEKFLLETIKHYLPSSDHYSLELYEFRGKSIEMLMFLIDQLSDEKKNQFIETNVIKLFRFILPQGPYNDYIFQLLDNYFMNFKKNDYENLLMSEILESIKDDELAFMKIRHYNLVFEKILAEMKNEDRNEFLKKNSVKLVEKMLIKLPLNDLILDLINNIKKNEISIDVYHNILGVILKLLKEGNEAGVKLNQIYLVFRKIFGNLRASLKDDIFNSFFFYEKLVFYDEELLNVILINMERSHKIKLFKKLPFREIFLENTEQLNRFMNHVLNNNDERLFYKNYLLESIENMLWSLEFEFVDKILDYFSSSEDERQILKNKIDPLEFVKGFIINNWRYDKAERFLRWMYPKEVERESFRNSIDRNWFLRERTKENWNEKLELVMQPRRDLRDDYYKFFFGFPEEINHVHTGEDFYAYRQKLGEHFVEIYGKHSQFWQHKNISELPDLFMKWVCKDVERRDAIDRSYRDDKERILFCKIIETLLSLNYDDEDLVVCRKVRLTSGFKLASWKRRVQ